MKKSKKLCYLILFSVLFVSMLIYPSISLEYASMGLQLWFNKMIPTLLPFMILSSIMIQLQINTTFMRIFEPILYPIFHVNKQCLYAIFIGFLCGFPMGAKTCQELYELKKITKAEAEYLLSFNNNIGPVYFVSFVLATLQIKEKWIFLFGMYGIPLLYGILLRYTIYRKVLSPQKILSIQAEKRIEQSPTQTLMNVCDYSIFHSLKQITMLGGYMVLFNVLNIFVYLFHIKNPYITAFLNCLLEITGGLNRFFQMNQNTPFTLMIIFTSLIFGGLSCLAQTMSILNNSDLDKKKYLVNKLILTTICGVYYGFVFFAF